ncbi:MAG: peptidoglycan DD-metalloendopeptidase family protein [Paraclostridium sp.]|uniref:M23 family metallopeptidase n=1 Tax=Paraclostridium sp. TaxID=2023273 RepID=UPI003F313325
MLKKIKILTILGLIIGVNTYNVYGLENNNTSEEIVKDIYNLEIEQRKINGQINQVEALINSKKESENYENEVEVVQLSFVDEDTYIESEDIIKSSLVAEIEALESLKVGLEKDRNELKEKNFELKDELGETFNYGCWPVNGFEEISSPFGYRIHPISKERKLHKGVDIPASYGVDILATDYGVVTFSGVQNGYGNVVYIKHFDGKTSIYGHNSENVVNEGDIVAKGQTIAKIGSTGASTGNHVHFEVSLNGELQNPLDITNK